MPRLGHIKRRDLIRFLKELGFDEKDLTAGQSLCNT